MNGNFIEAIFANLTRDPNGTLVYEMHGQREHAVHNRRLLGKIWSLRRLLQNEGVAAGDRVVILAKNSADWVAADLAVLAEGAVVVPLYARQGAGELAELIHHADPSLVLVSDAVFSSLDNVLSGALKAKLRLLEREANGAADATGPVAKRPGPDPVSIIYTSGTSGSSKGAVLSTASCDFMLRITRDGLDRLAGRSPAQPGQDRVFHYLPFCFAGSRVLLWTCLSKGNPIWISTDLDQLQAELKGADPEVMLNVPFLLERIRSGVVAKVSKRSRFLSRLLARSFEIHLALARGPVRARERLLLALAKRLLLEPIRKQIGPKLRAMLCGSAPLQEETQRWFQMVGIPVFQIYGLTETTAIVTMDDPERVIPGYVGPPVEGVEVSVRESGELWVKGPNIFLGYFQDEAASAAVVEEGWFKTGDLVEQDARGNLRIVGRKKNVLILAAGHNVVPEPLEEQLLARCPGAEHAVLVGHGRPFLSALVTGDCDHTMVEQAIEQLNATLPHYKRIREWHLASERLTPENGLLTANQKLKRAAIEKHFEAVLKRIYEGSLAPQAKRSEGGSGAGGIPATSAARA